MAYPYLSEKNFAAGTNAEFDSETDSSSYLNIRSYPYLAGVKMPVPYRGAYAPEIDLATKSTSTNGAYFVESGDLDTALAAAGTAYAKFYFYAPSVPAWTMANNDVFSILSLHASAEEIGVQIKYTTAAGYALLATDGTGTASCALEFDKWHCVELYTLIDSGVGNDGTIDFYLDGNQIGSQIAAADQGAITEYRYGCIGPDAGTTSGRYYLGPIYFDDARMYPDTERFPFNRIFSLTEQIFVGPGHIDSAALLTTGASNDLKLYDTDLGSSSIAEDSYKVHLSVSTHTSVNDPIRFDKGCYAVLAGTSPRAQIVLTQGSSVPGVIGPIYYSDRGIRLWATKR